MAAAKNNAIPFWRIIFTYMIVIFHFDFMFPYSEAMGVRAGWYIGVEFFFLVSGFLLYRKVMSPKAFDSAFGYTLHRYQSLYLKYLMAFAVTFLAVVLLHKRSIGAAELLADSFFEILLLQEIGLGRAWDFINPTLWYLSVLVIAGHIIYYLLLRHRKLFLELIGPVLILVSASVLYRYYGWLDAVTSLDQPFFINGSIFRGLMEMTLGVYCAMFSDRIAQTAFARRYAQVSWVLFPLVIFAAAWKGHSKVDFLLLFLLFFGVAGAFLPTENRFLSHPLIQKWGGITLNLYLLHELFRCHVFPALFPGPHALRETLLYLVLYVLAVTAAAVVFEFIYGVVHDGLQRAYQAIRAD